MNHFLPITRVLLFVLIPCYLCFLTPSLTRVKTIAADKTGHLRDPSSVILVDGTYWFVSDYIPLSQGTPGGWHAFLHYYSAKNITGEWTDHGLLFNRTTDENAFDYAGTFSSSLIYDNGKFWVFYTGTGKNYSSTEESAQLVASSPTMHGPWTRHGLVAYPTGKAPTWNQTWNARRLDSGRIMKIKGKRIYFTKGVSHNNDAQEGAYFPDSSVIDSLLPPYKEYDNNPIFPGGSQFPVGYENCEFLKGPENNLHVVCNSHGDSKIPRPHFIADIDDFGLTWKLLGNFETLDGALEPTPVYEDSYGSETAQVNYMIARTETKGLPLHIDLYKIAWV